MAEEINKGCEFQNNCIEYKDISYLKIMPICAIHELSIACHDKVNKCKYYKLYEQLERLEQERDELKKACEKCKLLDIEKTNRDLLERIDKLERENKELKEENKQHIKEKQILHERLYCYAYEKDCHLVCKQQNCLLKNSYAYRSALEEIKEIAYGGADVNDCTFCYDIYNKINEVLGDN